MDDAIKVAVVQGDRRRGAVAQALALIADDVRAVVQPYGTAAIVPTLDELGRDWASTDRDTLSATTDALLAAGADALDVVASKADARPSASRCFESLGYLAETHGRPVAYHDLDAEPDAWAARDAVVGGRTESLRVSSRFAASGCRVSLGIARTDETFRLGLSLPALAAILHRDDRWEFERAMLARRLPRRLVPACSLLETWRGRLARAWLSVRSVGGGMRLTGAERRSLDRIERATGRLSALATIAPPRLSLIDGFSGMHGQAPRLGTRLRLGTVIAGTDPVAVDAVAAAIMGFDPLEVAYLRRAQAAGLGVSDLAAITIVGEPWSQVRRKCRRHAADRLLRLVSGSIGPEAGAGPGPHFRSRRKSRSRRSTRA
ncbi:DUF362 domain-containing protein [Planctomyces sp. SH-PL62]|uniref:DUF362 domain-containing protein n=1 Tax=Planctomyces sp. SH-PL62 TaxID=1636152 RepID=UPI00078C5116|nr:DUF362 domain-containing protein [Planctomyces sp. SH-PL62]AMV37100.1 hypothetical protein VT85_06690 [Planctomyces sp. SH-PL62]